MLNALATMKLVRFPIKKLDHGRSDFSTAVELAAGALLIAATLRWVAL